MRVVRFASSCCTSSSDWSAKLNAAELVDINVGCGAVVTGWKHMNHRILWHHVSSSAGTGGTTELVMKQKCGLQRYYHWLKMQDSVVQRIFHMLVHLNRAGQNRVISAATSNSCNEIVLTLQCSYNFCR